MPLSKYLIAAALTFIVMVPLDLLWLGVIAKNFYFSRLGELMLPTPRVDVAIAFYVIYAIGLTFFAVTPALRDGAWSTALVYGGLFGFFAYATYDLTNWATLRNWPVAVVFVDIAWGVVVSGTSATLGFLLSRWLAPA